MAWYWIVLIVAGYLNVAIVAFTLYTKKHGEDPFVAFVCVFWPIALAVAILAWPAILLNHILKKK